MTTNNFLTGLFIFVCLALLGESIFAIKTQLLDRPDLLVTNDLNAYLPGALMLKEGQGQNLYVTDIFHSYQHRLALPYARPNLVYRALPFVTFLYLPFIYFSYRTAFILYSIFSIILVTGIIVIAYKIFPKIALLPLWFLLPFAASPTSNAIYQGQPSAIQTFSLFSSFWLLKKSKSFLSGLILSLLLIKPHILIILAILLIPIIKSKQFFIGLGTGIISLVFISWLIVGTKPILDYPQYIISTESSSLGTYIEKMSSLPSLIQSRYGIFTSLLITLPLVIYFLFLLSKNNARYSIEQLFSIALLLTPVFAYHVSNYDLQLLLFPIFFLLHTHFSQPKSTASQTFLTLAIVIFVSISLFNSHFVPYLHVTILLISAIYLLNLPTALTQIPKPSLLQPVSKS